MAKIAIVTDIHVGVSNDSPIFLDETKRFFRDFMFPYMRKNKIKSLINAGDTFDKRKQINYKTLDAVKEFYFDVANSEFDLYALIGNHDCPYKSTNKPNSVELLCEETYPNIRNFSSPQEVQIEGENFLFLPWINKENYTETLEMVNRSSCDVVIGHLEIAGFSMLKGIENKNGLSRKLFSKFEYVLSGHFHYRSSDGNIHYLGNPHETTWADYGNAKGFHVFDTKTRELEFIENPRKIYHKFLFNSQNPPELPKDLTGKFVMVEEVYSKKSSEFDAFCDKVKSLNPFNYKDKPRDKVVSLDKDGNVEEDKEIKVESTEELIRGYIKDNVVLHDEGQMNRLEDFMLSLYKEAGEL